MVRGFAFLLYIRSSLPTALCLFALLPVLCFSFTPRAVRIAFFVILSIRRVGYCSSFKTFSMLPNAAILSQQGFLISDSLPVAYKGFLLPGSEVMHALNNEADLLFQQFRQPQFALRLQRFRIFTPLELVLRQGQDMLVALLALKNNVHLRIHGLSPLLLRAGEFALFHLPEQELTLAFPEKEEYHHLEVTWSGELLQTLLGYFPVLETLFTMPATQAFFLGTPGLSAPSEAIYIAHTLLQAPANPSLHAFYYENRVKDYLRLLLDAAFPVEPVGIKLSAEERERLNDIAALLRRELARKFPIPQLAVSAHMNTMKLKTAFKALFQKGIFEYQLAFRMQEAHRLLEEGELTIKAIAARIGYRHTTSFTQQFIKTFHYGPSEVSPKP
jgi:AraC-like DNA-binding protein